LLFGVPICDGVMVIFKVSHSRAKELFLNSTPLSGIIWLGTPPGKPLWGRVIMSRITHIVVNALGGYKLT
ncbi:hypothetical protein KZ310_32615, partial [Escherichia coli]|nr:hypothetical protein [Escherichia coli]